MHSLRKSATGVPHESRSSKSRTSVVTSTFSRAGCRHKDNSDILSRYAANALVYTSAGVGDWYGSLSAQDASNFVNVVLDADVAKPDDMTSIWWAKWRGRIGLSQEEQVALYENRKALANVSLSAKDSYAAILKAAKAKRLDRKTQKRIDELGEDLIQIKFEKDGKSHNLSGFEGETVKDVAKRAELVDATCGGFLEVRPISSL